MGYLMLLCLPFLLAGGAALAWPAFSMRYALPEYTVPTPKLPAGARVRILLLSDLHSEPSAKRRDKLAAMIHAAAPDLILLAGDIVDDLRLRSGAEAFFRELQTAAPRYYAYGNHEFRGDLPEIDRLLQRAGVHILSDCWETVEVCGQRMLIAGMDDPESPAFQRNTMLWGARAKKVFAPLVGETGCFRILISHRPDLARVYRSLPFDLVVSGHAHGGQVHLPGLPDGLYAPDQGLLPADTGGMRRYPGGVTHIISRGAAVYPAIPRLWNPPELVLISLQGTCQ